MLTHSTTRLVAVALLALAGLNASADPPAASQPATRPAKVDLVPLAERWCAALLAGDVDTAVALSQTPFSWDRTATLADEAELRRHCQAVADKKGPRVAAIGPSRQLPADQAAKVLQQANLAGDLAVVLVQVNGRDGVAVILKPGDEPKVAGFSD